MNGLPIDRCKDERLEMRRLPLKQRANAVKAAHWLLQEWPHRFIEIALNNYVKRKDIFGEFPNAPFWFWEPLHYGMAASLPVKTEVLNIDSSDQCTARLKDEQIETSDYDFDIDEVFYGEMYAGDNEDYIPNEDADQNEVEEDELVAAFDD